MRVLKGRYRPKKIKNPCPRTICEFKTIILKKKKQL